MIHHHQFSEGSSAGETIGKNEERFNVNWIKFKIRILFWFVNNWKYLPSDKGDDTKSDNSGERGANACCGRFVIW